MDLTRLMTFVAVPSSRFTEHIGFTIVVTRVVRGLSKLNRIEEAITILDQVEACFGEAAELELRVQVARALVNKGVTLSVRNRTEEAITVYNQVAARFGNAAESALRDQVASALVNKESLLLPKSEKV